MTWKYNEQRAKEQQNSDTHTAVELRSQAEAAQTMHEHSASLMQSEDDMSMYFEGAEDENVDESNHEAASPTRAVSVGMPDEFYHGLESFLAQAPPALEMFSSSNNGGSGGSSKDKLEHPRQQPRRQPPPPQQQQQQQQQTRARSKQRQTSNGSGSGEFDYELLQQAMQYTAKLALEDCTHDQADVDALPLSRHQQHQQHQQRRRHSRQSIADRTGQGKPPLRRNSSSRSAIVVRKRSSAQLRSLPPAHVKKRLPRQMREAMTGRQDQSQLQREASWNAPSAADTRTIEADNCLDVASLVENFEKGIMLEQLRQELAASHSSMNRSHEILSKAAAEFFAQHGGSL